MALVTSIAQSKIAFNATQDSIFYFVSVGGDQVVKNKLTIRDNATDTEVYTNTLETFAFQQTVPANTLTNGTYYNFYFNTYNEADDESDDSNSMPFYCYTSPTIVYDNLPSGNVINGSSYNFSATYNQIEGELLDYLIFNLYDGTSGTLIATSGELRSTDIPPITFTHFFTEFEDGGSYDIEVSAVSQNGTITTSTKETLTVQYTNPDVFSSIDLENFCEDGYVEIDTNLVISDGISDPTPPTYVRSGTMVDLGKYGYNVSWDDGFYSPSSFICRIKYMPAMEGLIATWKKSASGLYRYELELVKEVPYGETVMKDYFVLKGYNDTTLVVNQKTNYLEDLNNNSEVFIWIKKVDDTYEFITEILSTETNQVLWNGTSNVEYRKITNIPILGSTAIVGDEFVPLAGSMDDIFPIEYMKIENGVFDHLQISECIADTYSTTIPEWDYCTRFDCDFDENINGGNTDIVLSQLKYLRIKRRLDGDFTWVQLFEKEINVIEDLDIVYDDYYTQSGKVFYYAVVPVSNDGTEGDYITATIETSFNHTYISDSTKTFILHSNVGLSGTQVRPIGEHIVLNSKYPKIVANGMTNYEKGSLSGSLLGYTFYENREVDRYNANVQLEEFRTWITNGDSKVIKDYNGRIKVVQIDTNSMPITYNMTNGFSNVSFNWIEQGDYNTEDDLIENGLIE